MKTAQIVVEINGIDPETQRAFTRRETCSPGQVIHTQPGERFAIVGQPEAAKINEAILHQAILVVVKQTRMVPISACVIATKLSHSGQYVYLRYAEPFHRNFLLNLFYDPRPRLGWVPASCVVFGDFVNEPYSAQPPL